MLSGDEFKDRLNRLKKRDEPFILPADAAYVLGKNPQYIREYIRGHPEWLDGQVIRINKKSSIPRKAFVKWCESL